MKNLKLHITNSCLVICNTLIHFTNTTVNVEFCCSNNICIDAYFVHTCHKAFRYIQDICLMGHLLFINAQRITLNYLVNLVTNTCLGQ